MLGELIQSQHLVVHHSNCPRCRIRMYLARLQLEKTDQDRLTFECPQCGYVELEIVKVH